jgi:hypothetical protein
MKPDDTVWTGHGTRGAVDTTIGVDHDGVFLSVSRNSAREAGQQARRRIAVATAIGETLIIQTRADMNARSWSGRLHHGGKKLLGTRMGGRTGKHALHTANAACGMHNDFFHKRLLVEEQIKLVSIPKWSFCPISASISGIASTAHHRPSLRNPLISLTLGKNPLF